MPIIRECIETDYPALRVIYLLSRKETFNWVDPLSFYPDDFDKHTEGEKILVAESQNKIAGFVSVWMPDNFIHHLYLHPEYTNRGIGKMLLAAAIEIANKPLTLKCLINNRYALKFYKKQGWRHLSDGISEDGAYYLLIYP